MANALLQTPGQLANSGTLAGPLTRQDRSLQSAVALELSSAEAPIRDQMKLKNRKQSMVLFDRPSRLRRGQSDTRVGLYHGCPNSQEAHGKSLMATGSKIFDAVILLVTVGTMTALAKSMFDEKSHWLISALGAFASFEYFVFLMLMAGTVFLGGMLHQRGLRLIREAEREARRMARKARARP